MQNSFKLFTAKFDIHSCLFSIAQQISTFMLEDYTQLKPKTLIRKRAFHPHSKYSTFKNRCSQIRQVRWLSNNDLYALTYQKKELFWEV
jgi:hypothetical protein